MTEKKDVIVLIHGIRDFAAWQVSIRHELEANGFTVEPTNYSRFDILRFLLPISIFRNSVIERVWSQIQQIQQIYPAAKLSFIAHSFGTFVLAEILRREFTFTASRVIFCGSVVKYDFPFEQINGRFVGPVINEVGTRDIWPALAASVTTGYGSAGTYGFRRPHVRDRWHNGKGHSDFLTAEFCRKFWVPFLHGAAPLSGDVSPEAPAWWLRLLTIVQVKYIAVVVVAAILLTTLPNAYSRHELRPVSEWVVAVEAARKSGTVHSSRPLPNEILDKRTRFENWWQNAGLNKRNGIASDVAYKALSLNSRLYRIAEIQSEAKPNANYWNEQCLSYFEQRQDARYVTECLLERAALFLELSQIEHTDAEKFRRIAQEGDAVMARATSLADSAQRPEIFRIWSRFYYNMARPQSGLLSSAWSNNYLNLAYEKAKTAYQLAPSDIKNATQLSRATQKYAANPPQNNDPAWTIELRRVQKLMLEGFREHDKALTSPTARIPPLNILGVITMDVVRREWLENQEKLAASAIQELEQVAVVHQREAWALVEHTEWAKDYRFDLNYDLGRIQSVVVQIRRSTNDMAATSTFSELIANMKVAANGASGNQLKAAYASIESDPNLSGLSLELKEQARAVFAIR